MRPPSTYVLTIHDAAAYDAAFPSGVSLAAPGGSFYLSGVEVGRDGTLAGAFGAAPVEAWGVTFNRPVAAGAYYEMVPVSIDSVVTDCWPIHLYYGPLGMGAR